MMTTPSSDGTAMRWWPLNAKPFYRPTLMAAIAAAVGVMIGSLSPWVSAFIFTVNGLDTGFWGVMTLTIGALSALVLLVVLFWGVTPLDPRWAVPLAWSVLVGGAACLATGLVILFRLLTAPKADVFGVPVGPGVGWGLWLLTVSSVVLCVTASIGANYVGQTVDRNAPIGETTTTSQAWRLGAILMAGVVAIVIGVLLALDWSPTSVGDTPSDSPSFPSFPSFPSTTDFPSFPSTLETDESTTSTIATPTTPVLGSPCDSSQYNETTTSVSGTPLRCLPTSAGRYTWSRDTGTP
jgi:hypothetical protein